MSQCYPVTCHNHTENKDKERAELNINIHTFSMATDVPVCTSIEDIRGNEYRYRAADATDIHSKGLVMETKITWSLLYVDTGK